MHIKIGIYRKIAVLFGVSWLRGPSICWFGRTVDDWEWKIISLPFCLRYFNPYEDEDAKGQT